jgi:hypothetical protein
LFTSILVASVVALVQAQSACNSVAAAIPTCAVSLDAIYLTTDLN